MASSIFIKGVLASSGHTNIIITGRTISRIAPDAEPPAGATVIEASHMAALPSFANMHSHAPMTLLRGMGSDQPLKSWLNNYIWPAEQQLDDEAVYWGTRLACLEMIKSGTTAFNDMYFRLPAMAQGVADSGIQAMLGLNLFGDAAELDRYSPTPADGIAYSVAPHSIYTVSTTGLQRAANFCQKHSMPMHIHMAETIGEVDDCQRLHGCRPFELIDRLGVLEALGPRLIAAHCLHLTESEIQLIGRHGCTVVHCPNSNLKLGSGYRFNMLEMEQAGANVTIGTDGCASSDNLCMLEASKTAILLQKGWRADPAAINAEYIMDIATINGFNTLGIKAGRIAEGWQADMALVDLNQAAFIPRGNILSHYLYAAHSCAIDTVICRGRILMQGRHVDDEETIIANALKAAQRFTV